MIRNPRSLNFFSDKWNYKDSRSWSDDFVKQVPFGFNPLEKNENGIFIIELSHMKKCFNNLNVAYLIDEYKSSWFDFENDINAEVAEVYFEIPKELE